MLGYTNTWLTDVEYKNKYEINAKEIITRNNELESNDNIELLFVMLWIFKEAIWLRVFERKSSRWTCWWLDSIFEEDGSFCEDI